MPKWNSGLGEREGNHPRVNDIDMWGTHDSDDDDSAVDRGGWLQDNLKISWEDAYEGQKTIFDYTGDAYERIHSGKDMNANEIIDSIIHNPNAPVFTGAQYRGLYIDQTTLNEMGYNVTPREYLEQYLKGGVWRENGATSFSASEHIAQGFAKLYRDKRGSGDVSVVISYVGGKSGMPIKHLSYIPNEDEVLHSGRQMKAGMKIVSYQWVESAHGTELYITVDDMKRKGRR